MPPCTTTWVQYTEVNGWRVLSDEDDINTRQQHLNGNNVTSCYGDAGTCDHRFVSRPCLRGGDAHPPNHPVKHFHIRPTTYSARVTKLLRLKGNKTKCLLCAPQYPEKHYGVWRFPGGARLSFSSIKMKMSMEQWWNDTDRGKLKYWERNIIERGW